MPPARADLTRPPTLRLQHGVIEAAWFSEAPAGIETLPLGGAVLVRIDGGATRGNVVARAHGRGAFDAVGLVVAGTLSVGELGAAVCLQPGQAFLWNSRQSGPFEASHGLQLLHVMVPSERMRSRWPALSSGDGPRRPEAPGWAMEMAAAALHTLWCRRGQWSPQDLADAAAAALDLLSRPAPAQAAPPSARLSQLVALIDASLEDPGLGPAMLAARLGVSVRTLHALAARHRMTVGGLVRRRRLEGSRARLLADGPHARIGDIAAQCGFPDPARFSKAFKAAFGVQPREFRRLRAAPAAEVLDR